MSGASDILKERNRQINKLGYDVEHDRQHSVSSLEDAAWFYMTIGSVFWPFDSPTPDVRGMTRREQLVRTGAMVAALIDKLDNE